MNGFLAVIVADGGLLGLDPSALSPTSRLLGLTLAWRAVLTADRLGADAVFVLGPTALVEGMGERHALSARVTAGAHGDLVDALLARPHAMALFTCPFLLARARHLRAFIDQVSEGPLLGVARWPDPVRPWRDVTLLELTVARIGRHLGSEDGQELPLVGLPASRAAELLSGEGELLERLALPGRTRAFLFPDAAFVTVLAPRDLPAAARFLQGDVGSSSDGLVDRYLNRRVSRFLTLGLIDTRVTPNGITLASMGIGLSAVACFLAGGYGPSVVGGVLLQLSAMVDCADGEVARLKYLESRLGSYLDIIADNVVHVLLFLAIGRAVALTHGELALRLGGAAAAGALLSFLLVFATVIGKGKQGEATAEDQTVERFVDRMTNRDFSILLLAAAIADRLHWFLWALAIGVQLFWMALLALKVRAFFRRRAGSAASPAA